MLKSIQSTAKAVLHGDACIVTAVVVTAATLVVGLLYGMWLYTTRVYLPESERQTYRTTMFRRVACMSNLNDRAVVLDLLNSGRIDARAMIYIYGQVPPEGAPAYQNELDIYRLITARVVVDTPAQCQTLQY